MPKINLSYKHILLLLIISALVRYFYYFHAPGVFVSNDTYSYYLTGERMIAEKLFVGDFRPPIYPLFLHLVSYAKNHAIVPMLTKPFFDAMSYVVLIQFLLDIFAIAVFYRTLLLINFKAKAAFLFSLIYSFNIIVFSWDRQLLAESFTAVWLTLFFYFLVRMVREPDIKSSIVFWIFSLIGVLLKPVYLLLPLPLVIIIFLFKTKRHFLVGNIVLFILYISFIAFYTNLNFTRFQYKGLSRAGDINLFGKVLDFHLPLNQARNDKFYYQSVTEFWKNNQDMNPYRFLEQYDLIREERRQQALGVGPFGRQVIFANLSVFLYKSTLQIPVALMETSEKTVLLPYNSSPSAFFYQILFHIYKYMQIVFILVFPLLLADIYAFSKKKVSINTIFLSLGVISFYQIVFSVFLSYGEFGRLISPAQPLIYLYCFYHLNKLISKFRICK